MAADRSLQLVRDGNRTEHHTGRILRGSARVHPCHGGGPSEGGGELGMGADRSRGIGERSCLERGVLPLREDGADRQHLLRRLAGQDSAALPL